MDNFNNTGSVVHAGTIEGNVNQQTNVTNKHINVTVKPKVKPAPISFQKIDSDPNFTGRTSELRILEKHCQNPPSIVVVYGLGGIGKTQLVRKYVENEKCRCSQNIIWINSSERESIQADFKSLAKNILKLNTDGIDFKMIFDQVLNKLCKLPTYIVLDNIDDEDVRKFVLESLLGIGTSGYRPRFVITSRIQRWKPKTMHVMKLKGLNDEEAVELVTNTLTDVHNDSLADIKKLVAMLQNFPLTLRQATAHINYQREEKLFTIDNYIDEYKSFRKEYLDSEYFKEETFFKYKETTYTTWRVTIAAIEKCKPTGDLALRILRIIAYFEADHIRRDIFFNLLQHSSSNKILENDSISAIRLLVNYSMIESRENQSILSIHRLVQEVIKIDLGKAVDVNKTVLHDGLHIISEMRNHPHFKETLEHGISIFLSALILEDLIREFSAFPIMILRMLNEVGKHYRTKSFGDQILPDLTRILGEGDIHTIRSKSQIAYSYREVGNNTEALQMFQEIHEKYLSTLGEDSEYTIDAEKIIAYTYQQMGKHAEALRIFQKLFEKEMRIFGEDHADTLKTKSVIAFSYRQLGKHTEALQMFQQVYEKRLAILGEDHRDTMRSKSSVATSYRRLGKHLEALQMFQEVFEKEKIILGEDHPDTIASMSIVAMSYRKLGKHVESSQMFREVYEKEIVVLGEDHPDTLTSKSILAYSYYLLGKNTEAMQMFEEVLDKRRIILGEDHPDTISSKSNIGTSYRNLGKHTESLRIFREVYEKETKILGEAHPNTISSKSDIATQCRELGKFAESLQMFEDVYEKRKNILGDDHPDTISSKSEIATSHYAMGEYTVALQMFEDVYEKRRNILGENHPDTISSKSDIANSYRQDGKLNEALQMFEDVYEKRKNILGEEHPDTISSKSEIATSHYAMGEYTVSLQMFEDVYEKRRNILGENHPDTISSKSDIANSYRQDGKLNEALQMFEDVYEKRKNILGEEHPDTISSKSEIDNTGANLNHPDSIIIRPPSMTSTPIEDTYADVTKHDLHSFKKF